MKSAYVKPTMMFEVFKANECIAACQELGIYEYTCISRDNVYAGTSAQCAASNGDHSGLGNFLAHQAAQNVDGCGGVGKQSFLNILTFDAHYHEGTDPASAAHDATLYYADLDWDGNIWNWHPSWHLGQATKVGTTTNASI